MGTEAWSQEATPLDLIPFVHENQVTPQQAACVFFARHAETAADTKSSRNPELSDAGVARATALADLLEHAGVTHLIASEYQRTQSTLKVLAERTGVEVVVVMPARSFRVEGEIA